MYIKKIRETLIIFVAKWCPYDANSKGEQTKYRMNKLLASQPVIQMLAPGMGDNRGGTR